MAPAPDQFSAAGAASYDSDTMSVGDGTWDFTKNNFLLPNLQGTNFDTMRYNGMGNRFATLTQYHSIILAHAILAVMVFLFLVPTSVMLARFYSREPGYAIRYHAQLHVFAGILLLAAFILPFFAVGPKRNLSNPHHGIGVAIFVLFILQLVGGRLVRKISKLRSFRIMLHQWSGRAIALLGIVQVPLGLTLYGSPKYLFILYTLWMSFLLLLYFILSYRSAGRREMYMSGPVRSEAGQTRLTESEYFSEHKENHGSKWKWLGPLAAGAGLFALMRSRKKDRDTDDDRSRPRSRATSLTRSRGPTTVMSSRPSYFEEKYSDLSEPKKRGGGLLKVFGGAAGAFGAAKLFSSFMNRRSGKDEEYSAVSTETPRRNRSGRATTVSEFDSEYTDDLSTIPPSRHPAGTETRTADPRRPNSPPRPSGLRNARGYDDSEYSSYVSPSRRVQVEPARGGGFAKGLLSGIGMGWITQRLADRRSKKDEDRLRAEEEMRSGTQFSRYTGDGHPSPTRRDSRRQPPRRSTGPATAVSEFTESSFDSRRLDESELPPRTPPNPGRVPPALAPGDSSRARRDPRPVTVDSELDSSELTSIPDRQRRRGSSRRYTGKDEAAAAAAARASSLAAAEQLERFGSRTSNPVSVKLKVHDDKDRNVTLRRLTEEEEASRSRGRADSETSLSALETPTKSRRYRRDSSQRRVESRAESRVEEDTLGPLSPPHPAFAKGGRRGKDSGYYSGQPGQPGQPGPSNSNMPMPSATVSSLDTHGTWSGMSVSPSSPKEDKGNESAADNRRRRRMERRQASSSRPSAADMYD